MERGSAREALSVAAWAFAGAGLGVWPLVWLVGPVLARFVSASGGDAGASALLVLVVVSLALVLTGLGCALALWSAPEA